AMLTVAVLAALAIAGAAASQARPAEPADPPTGTRAVVMVSTPDLPTGDGPPARGRWHELRAVSSQVLDRVARRNDLRVESHNPDIGALSVDVGQEGLAALRRELASDPRVEAVMPDVPVQLRAFPNDYALTHADPHAPNGDVGNWNVVHEGGPRAWDLSSGAGA